MASLASHFTARMGIEANLRMKKVGLPKAFVMFVISHVIVINWHLIIYFMILFIFTLTFSVQAFASLITIASIWLVLLLSQLFMRLLQQVALE